nr:integrase, catalytic region, zinc finger, CCHC-type, peptidase aspartic, catalytic [Tanacetum cinerariifolium]
MQASLQGKDNAIRQLKKQLSELKKQFTSTKPSDRQDSNKNKHVVSQKIQKTNVPVPDSTGVKRCPKAGGSQPKSNHKTNRISLAKGTKKLCIEDLPRTNKSHLRTTNRVDSNSRLKRTLINLNSDSICQTCNKFLPSFDHDMVYYVEGLGHNLFSVRQFCDSDLEVAFRKHSCYVRDTNGVDLKVVATACYTQNRSLIHTRHHKTPYELVHNKKPDLTFFRVFGPAPTFLMPGQISSGLVPNPVPATPYAPPTNKELEILFQPMFDEYLEPPRAERPDSPAQAV